MSTVDLSPIVQGLNTLNHNLNVVDNHVSVIDDKVGLLAQEQGVTRSLLDKLYDEFSTFVQADLKHKERQFAATRLIEVRQALEKQYGHYEVVRRTTTGILQATDVALVRAETMRTVTENLMLTVPSYWLAPALVALTAWLADNRELAERAMTEALRRDDSKTSLFFSIVCKRADRLNATSRWLRRYFQNQSPFQMDREVVVMLDALTHGLFGGTALAEASDVIEHWVAELEEQAGFADAQRKRWSERLEVMAPRVGESDYPKLRRNCPTWSKLEKALARSRRNGVVQEYFEKMFTGEIVVPPGLEPEVDALLQSLVTHFDDEELPMRREERLLQLIMEEQGDKDAAQRRLHAEVEVFEDRIDFAALLTNAAMNPEQSGATRATQRYAVSRCRQWILSAHEDLVARDRNEMPAEVDLKIDSWNGRARDGSDESKLVTQMATHYETLANDAEKTLKLSGGQIIGGALVAVVGLIVAFPMKALLLGLVLMLGAGGYLLWKNNEIQQARKRERERIENERDTATSTLKACLAELTDLRREITATESQAERVSEFIRSLSSTQFVLQRPELSRATVA